tara:strand:- start:2151 stop:2276 length:126 start_codon:yes stop_codon:yes gene_type:complete
MFNIGEVAKPSIALSSQFVENMAVGQSGHPNLRFQSVDQQG